MNWNWKLKSRNKNVLWYSFLYDLIYNDEKKINILSIFVSMISNLNYTVSKLTNWLSAINFDTIWRCAGLGHGYRWMYG